MRFKFREDYNEMTERGYWIDDKVFSAFECETLISILSEYPIKRGRAGARHLMHYPAVSDLAADRRLLEIAQHALGGRAEPFRATLFEKSGKANWLVTWHQDTAVPLERVFEAPGWGPWSKKAGIIYSHAPTWVLSRIIALRLHLDAATNDNGPLRVIPGSHTAGVLSDNEVFTLASERDHTKCVVPRGGVLAMRPLLIHSSSRARSADPRRVLHLEYADSLKLTPDIALAIA